MPENNYTVYMHRNKTNDKVYIGSTSNPVNVRWKNGKGYLTQPRFYKAIKSFGWDGFDHIVICENLSEQDAHVMEMKFISKYMSDDGVHGYNVFFGDKQLERWHMPAETKQKIGDSHIGKRHSNAVKQLISCHRKGKNLGKSHKMYGKTFPDDWKKKLSENHSDVCGKNNPRAKKVLCIETDIIYDCVKDAAKASNLCRDSITRACTGQWEKAGGHHWKYVN